MHPISFGGIISSENKAVPSVVKSESKLLTTTRATLLALGLGNVLAAHGATSLLSPNGPMDVKADKAEYVRDGTSRLTGNVTLHSDTFSMDAAAMTMKQLPDGEIQGRLTGSPAHMRHEADQQGDPLMTAQALVMTYDTRTQIVELQGNARVTRGTDVITGNLIRYNVTDRRVEAVGGASSSVDGSGTKQVRIILNPKKKDGKSSPSSSHKSSTIPDEPLTLGTDKVFDTPTPTPPATPNP